MSMLLADIGPNTVCLNKNHLVCRHNPSRVYIYIYNYIYICDYCGRTQAVCINKGKFPWHKLASDGDKKSQVSNYVLYVQYILF